MFRSFIAWLNTRFPQQYVVTVAEYKQLREELGAYNNTVQGVGQLHDRLVNLEKQVNNLNAANGFVAQGKGSFKLER
jgi:hypothetical protein